MNNWQEVTLVGGVLDGQIRAVEVCCDLMTLPYDKGVEERVWGGRRYMVPQIGLESYRRLNDDTFVHCRTQTAIGDSDDLELPERQLRIEGETDG